MHDILVGIGPRLRWTAKVRVAPKDGAELNAHGIALADGLYKLRKQGWKSLLGPIPRRFYTVERVGNRKPGVRTLNLHILEDAYTYERDVNYGPD